MGLILRAPNGSKAEKLAISICCPLSRRKRTSLSRQATSPLWHKPTHAPQQTEGLFDYLVGAGEQPRRNFKTVRSERPRVHTRYHAFLRRTYLRTPSSMRGPRDRVFATSAQAG